MKRFLLILLILLIASPLWAATYYVDSSITDTHVASATPDFTHYNPTTFATNTGSSSVYKTLSDINACSFSSGDSILFRKGQTWREMLIVPSPNITFGAYGSGSNPVIAGDDNVLGVADDWIDQGSNIWMKNIGASPNPGVVSFDADVKGVYNNRVAAKYEWAYIKSWLSVYSVGNPTSYYTAIYMGKREVSIYAHWKPAVTYQNLTLKGGRQAGIFLAIHSDSSTISNLTVFNTGNIGFASGICINGASSCTISNNIVHHAYDGITITGYGSVTSDSNTVSSNTIYNNDRVGIQITDAAIGTPPNNNIVEGNTVYNCVQFIDDSAGIYTYGSGVGNIIRYNKSYNHGTINYRGLGIMLDIGSAATQVYYNLCYDSTYGGIALTGSGHTVYNNTLYHNCGQSNMPEISLFSSASNLKIKNNIVVASTNKHAIRIPTGCTTGHEIDYNVYYGGKANPFDYTETEYSFSNWKTASGYDDNSVLMVVITLQAEEP